ncbi:nucleoside monophosphate kinase [Candidatus Saccharibacteria bacterium]|nr:nucleoside monophosphate kinase [Candidatus Saccharibacteria bacterium]
MIILFGAAGSGKSTQGRILADKLGWRWLSVGQILRDTGRFAQTLLAGELVDDREVVRLMDHEIAKADADGAEIILDGYPRDVEQAQWLESQGTLAKIDAAIILKVPVDELWNRIEKRGRADDTREVVERRFRVYEDNVEKILAILEANHVKIIEVDGVGSFDDITNELIAVIEENVGEVPVVDEHLGEAEERSYGE